MLAHPASSADETAIVAMPGCLVMTVSSSGSNWRLLCVLRQTHVLHFLQEPPMNKPNDLAHQAADNFWNEYQAEEWSDALVQSMKLGGIDNLYFVSGSEMAFFQEAIAKAEARKRPAPKL